MSQENVESYQQAIDAFDRGDRAAWLALWIHPLEAFPPVTGQSRSRSMVAKRRPPRVEPLERQVRIELGGEVIAKSDRALRVLEGLNALAGVLR